MTLQIGEKNKILRQKSIEIKQITNDIKEIIKNMIKVMEENEGVGISACQIGHNLKISIITLRENKKGKEIYKGEEIMINPKIIYQSKETYIDEEGCLSLPNIFGKVKRNNWVIVKYLNLNGKKITKKFFNLTARIIQHEIDHLNGILFVDKLLK